MNWAVWVFAIAYPIIALALVRPLAGHHAWRQRRSLCVNCYARRRLAQPDGEAWFFGTCQAVLIAAVWPLLLVWLLSSAKGLKVGAERRALVDEQHQRIKELEAELGVGS